ncbi:MAG: ATP synthase F1 subunit delta [Pirellulales bacterium]|nr:ATP synthase F1 subunit delta [Pirellulales bacterium]
MTEVVKHETVLDTGAEQLGKTYAQALLGAANSAGAAEQVIEQLGQLVDQYLGNSPQLDAAFRSPRIDEHEKSRVIDRLFAEQFHPVLVKFLKVMAGRGRLGFVRAVREAAEDMHDEMLGRVLASVQTAVPLDDALRAQITERLGAVMNKQVRLRESVDPALIGGMLIRVGDRVFDSSVSNRLDKMARRTRDGFSSQLLQKFEQFTSE